ncbi:hypothetical protein MCUN1_003466 [Malassezia cuniculi]|uniref:Major facilitator superfamily (MFS) profile domain-containing protein n=1 Tax=Malassezia cuniculi TaxID=948313 RepID=A0AAF0J7U3_9BASI|nr:hypothetical protein MCUN1_003466 [Malassezia cuniculi]
MSTNKEGFADGVMPQSPKEIPAEEIPRSTTPEEIIYEDEDGTYRVLAEGHDAVRRFSQAERKQLKPRSTRPDGKIELTRDMAFEVTGFAFPSWKKWLTLSVIAVVQISMNFNTSVWPNAAALIPEDPRYAGVSEQGARVTQMIFLVAYAFGCELWAPWSEEFGRWPILQLSMFLVNCTQIWGVFSPNYECLIAARFFGGLFTAGGSVTLAVVADLYDAEDQQYALAFVVLSSCIGTSIGPFIGGFLAGLIPMENEGHWMSSLNWIFWTMLAFGGVTQILHAVLVPETMSLVLLDREARRRRANGEKNIYGPHEMEDERFSLKKIGGVWIRPFHMFVKEPIVLFCSLLSGFSDMLIFIFSESFTLVFKQWGFSTLQCGLAFIPVNVGYVIAFFTYLPSIHQQRVARRQSPDVLLPEARLYWLMFLAPLLPIGLFGFAWTSLGPPLTHWIAPMIFAVTISVANYAIYFATVDYMVEAYGVYSASATGGNAFARDLLAGISAMFSVPMYEKISPTHSYSWASTLLAFIAIVVVVPIYVFYWKGEQIRLNSKFSLEIIEQRREIRERIKQSQHPTDPEKN